MVDALTTVKNGARLVGLGRHPRKLFPDDLARDRRLSSHTAFSDCLDKKSAARGRAPIVRPASKRASQSSSAPVNLRVSCLAHDAAVGANLASDNAEDALAVRYFGRQVDVGGRTYAFPENRRRAAPENRRRAANGVSAGFGRAVERPAGTVRRPMAVEVPIEIESLYHAQLGPMPGVQINC
jgi:hypothetical protein